LRPASNEGTTPEASPIRVLIADDHPVVCLGLLGIINGQTDMLVVGQARTGTQAVALARKLSPDVILMDLRMPEMSGVEAIEAIRVERPDSAVIVLTTYQGDEDIRKAIAAGAQAYLVKGMSHLKLLVAIRSVRAGQEYFPRSIRNSVPGNLNRSALSPRELDILRLIVKGLNNQEIAEALKVSDDYVRRLFERQPGVIFLPSPGKESKRRHRTMRVPRSVLLRLCDGCKMGTA
jgi:DNA-binding NarL/FixJ family response regulator